MAAPTRTTQSLVVVPAAPTTAARDTQAVVLEVGAGGKPRATQTAALAVTTGGKTRDTQSLALAVTVGGKTRASQTVVLVLAPRPAPARDTNSLVLTTGASTATAQLTQSVALVLFHPPSPALATQSLSLVTAATGATILATQSLALTLASVDEGSASRSTQSLLLALGHQEDTGEARLTQSLLLLLKQSACDESCGLSLDTLRQRVLKLLGEDTGFPDYWRHLEIERLVNDAYIALARDTRAYEFVDTQPVVAGTEQYTFGSDVIQIRRVFVDDEPVRNVTKLEMDQARRQWGNRGVVWGYVSTQQAPLTIRLVEVPQADGTLDVWAAGIPAPMSGRCDIPALPSWSHQAIVFGAASRALRKHGEMRSLSLSDAYAGIYEHYRTALSGYVQQREAA